jgi:hypothetical protein
MVSLISRTEAVQPEDLDVIEEFELLDAIVKTQPLSVSALRALADSISQISADDMNYIGDGIFGMPILFGTNMMGLVLSLGDGSEAHFVPALMFTKGLTKEQLTANFMSALDKLVEC